MIENGGFDISQNRLYSIYMGIRNNMGALESYRVYVKLANLSDSLPNRTVGSASPLQPIFEYNLFLKNNEKFEEEIVFSFDDIHFERNVCQVSTISIGDQDIHVNKTVAWDELSQGFYCQLILELWIYDIATSDFQFHNRSVWLWLNLVGSS